MSQMLLEVQDAPNRVKAALQQDAAVYAKLGERLRELNPGLVATVARGSSDHAAAYATYLFPQCTGRVVASIPPSVVTVLKSPLNLENQFALAISQGGGSPDIIQTMDAIRRSGALTAALVNSEQSELARTAEILLPQHAGEEKSIAATKSVICSLLGVARIAAEWSGDQSLKAGIHTLPGSLERACEVGLEADEALLSGVSNVYVVSRGLGLSAAQEVALKLKETCGLHAEAFSAAEVRHGPREIVDKKFLVIVLALPGSGQDDALTVARELKAQGAGVLLVAPAAVGGGGIVLPEVNDHRLAPIVALELLYPWIARAAKALGRDPDRPKTLTAKVIKTV
jgi:glucosamine--fructose-6-phosphate aminotransferase (isomerizing)